MSFEECMSDAKPLIAQAVDLDKAGKLNDALPKYMEGIAKLMDCLSLMDQSDSRRTALRERINHYVGRAETIKAKTKIEISFLEQRRITAGSVGHGYDKVFSKCLDEKLTVVDVQDAYVNAHHQILNFVRFCELLVAKAPNLKTVSLLTGMESQSSKEAFSELQASLNSRNIRLIVRYSPELHDREIRFNNGWIVKIGRGLDYFKNPGRYAIGACDLNLKPCHETTIDIFKIK